MFVHSNPKNKTRGGQEKIEEFVNCTISLEKMQEHKKSMWIATVG